MQLSSRPKRSAVERSLHFGCCPCTCLSFCHSTLMKPSLGPFDETLSRAVISTGAFAPFANAQWRDPCIGSCLCSCRCSCTCLSFCHSTLMKPSLGLSSRPERSRLLRTRSGEIPALALAFVLAVAFALAFLSVIPEGRGPQRTFLSAGVERICFYRSAYRMAAIITVAPQPLPSSVSDSETLRPYAGAHPPAAPAYAPATQPQKYPGTSR